jgi:2-polyprenyl-3-methyl-5-hydroxy-6-metoxy-1,4-benzoquinol methylase
MITTEKETYYNKRLFSKGIRKYLHLYRFEWFSRQISRLNNPCLSFLELGCGDGKLINYLPNNFTIYKGFDANRSGGLDLALSKWKSYANCQFFHATSPKDMNLSNEKFDIAICMETLEHIPPEILDSYLEKISQHINGYFFVTIPNEKGIVFLLKWLFKKTIYKKVKEYSLAELWNATLGKMHLVERKGHKGFDYDSLIHQIEKHFEIVTVCGMPFQFLPTSLSFTVGVIAKKQ